MKKTIYSLLLFLCIPGAFAQKTLIYCGTLIDGIRNDAQTQMTLVVEGKKIVRVDKGYTNPTADEKVIDLKSKTVMPGFTDLHVHLESETSKDQYLKRMSYSQADIAFEAQKHALTTLMAGFITVRDLGGSGVNISLRNAINKGITIGPRIFTSGKTIATTGGHGDPTNGWRSDVQFPEGFANGVVDSPDAARQAVRQRYKDGVDCIKITATGGVLSIAKSGKAPQFMEDELEAIVKTAKDYGFHVAAHAHGTEGMKRAIRARLISRRTQGDLGWIEFANDYGNETALRGRNVACGIASSLMAYGGGGLSRDQLSARMAELKAEWSMSLGGIQLEAPRDTIDTAWDVLLAAWAAPALPPAEFDRLKAAAVAGIERAMKEPAAVASAEAAQRFDNYPDGHPAKPRSLEQQLAQARAVSLDDVQACVRDFLGVSQVRLAHVGRFTPDDVRATWAKLARQPAARIPYERVRVPDAPMAVDTQPITVALPDKPNATVSGMTLIALRDDHPDFPALRLAIKALGGDADSRIWQRLREKEGLAYGAGVSLMGSTFEARSAVALSATAASGQAEVALASLQDEWQRALNKGFDSAEIERVKRAWLQERKNSLRAEEGYAGSLAHGLYSGRDYAWLAAYDARIAQVSAEQASAALRKYLGTAPMLWMIGKGSVAQK